MSVLPIVGSELPMDSDEAAVVCTALLDEAVDDVVDGWFECWTVVFPNGFGGCSAGVA